MFSLESRLFSADHIYMLNPQILAELRSLGDDDPKFFKGLLQAFLQSVAGRLPTIKEAIALKSGEKLALAAHALKSSCLNLGAQKLGELCEELEKTGISGTTEGTDQLWAELTTEAAVVKREIEDLPEMKKDV